MRTRRGAVFAGMLAAVMALACVSAVTAGAAPRHRKPAAKTLYVSARGKHSGACTKAAPCQTIAAAIAKARRGETILVAHGTYREDVKVTKDVRLIGAGKPVIDAKGLDNGVLITGKGAAGALVRGFAIRNATFEGILALNTTRVTIQGNTVTHSDRGVSAAKPTGECAPNGPVPGDCGEGLHLWSVTHSRVLNNTVKDNAGGILLTDETGPTAFNAITANNVLDNVLDCGITLAGHNPKAVTLSAAPGPPTMTGLAPKVGGVYSNVVSGNVANGNGTKGQGGGLLLAAGPPGAGVYDNTFKDNRAAGNGLGGVTLHSHAPGQDLDGNVITHNVLRDNGVNGYPNGAPGDSDAGITHTVGIIIWSAVTPLTGTTVSGNQISQEYYGIWSQNLPKLSAKANTFASTVTVPLFQK